MWPSAPPCCAAVLMPWSCNCRISVRCKMVNVMELSAGTSKSAGFQRDSTALELLAQAEEAYVGYWYIREAVVVIDRQIALLEQITDLEAIIDSKPLPAADPPIVLFDEL